MGRSGIQIPDADAPWGQLRAAASVNMGAAGLNRLPLMAARAQWPAPLSGLHRWPRPLRRLLRPIALWPQPSAARAWRGWRARAARRWIGAALRLRPTAGPRARGL